MERKFDSEWSRRHFLSSVPCVLVGGSLFDLVQDSTQEKKDGSLLSSPFSVKEKRRLKNSTMAQDIISFPGKGYSCAESSFIVGLRYLKQPEKCVNAAAAYGGGIGRGDLCGLLTGGVMALGVAAGVLHADRSAMKDHVKGTVDEYWKWFSSMAPIHCEDLRIQCRDRENSIRMYQRVAAKLETLIRTE